MKREISQLNDSSSVSAKRGRPRRGLAVGLILVSGGAQAIGQGLSPSAPTKEYAYFNGRVVAVEERGPAGKSASVAAGVATVSASTTTTASKTAPTGTAPVLPVPGVAPQDTSSTAKQPLPTPANTHVARP